mmetsp:Transcript_3571/g.8763  ORF Transcript_3571/g.8763 Transcript_3571/m.8763 type:complete len:204 (+) Transcript_3571:56-667(+)
MFTFTRQELFLFESSCNAKVQSDRHADHGKHRSLNPTVLQRAEPCSPCNNPRKARNNIVVHDKDFHRFLEKIFNLILRQHKRVISFLVSRCICSSHVKHSQSLLVVETEHGRHGLLDQLPSEQKSHVKMVSIRQQQQRVILLQLGDPCQILLYSFVHDQTLRPILPQEKKKIRLEGVLPPHLVKERKDFVNMLPAFAAIDRML